MTHTFTIYVNKEKRDMLCTILRYTTDALLTVLFTRQSYTTTTASLKAALDCQDQEHFAIVRKADDI